MGMLYISEGREDGEKVIGSSRREGGVADLREKRALIVYISSDQSLYTPSM